MIQILLGKGTALLICLLMGTQGIAQFLQGNWKLGIVALAYTVANYLLFVI